MPQITDQYYIIAEFLYNSNRYAPSTRPYLYGELSSLPKHILENRNFIVPVSDVTVKSEKISDGINEVTVNNSETKLLQERVTIEVNKVQEPEIVVEEDIEKKEDVSELIETTVEVEDVKPKLTRKRKTV